MSRVSQIRTRGWADRQDPWIVEHRPAVYLSMIETADIVASRYGVSREAQDLFSVGSQQKAADAQRAGRYRDEIVPCTTMAVTDEESKQVTKREVTLDREARRLE